MGRTRKIIVVAGGTAAGALLIWIFALGNIYLPVRYSDSFRLTAIFEPADRALYESLLPRQVSMPETPLVKVVFVRVTPRWHEAYISLLCEKNGTAGWHGITWPIDSWVPYKFGYLVGYPKYMIPLMKLEEQNGTFTGTASDDNGNLILSLGFMQEEADPAREYHIGTFTSTPSTLVLVPPAVGPKLNRIHLWELIPLETTYRTGMIRIRFNPASPWAGLLPDGKEYSVPGFSRKQRGTGYGFLVVKDTR
jgi:hypothetical protein